MPFHFSSGISVFIIEHVPGFFSMRHSLTSLTLDLLLLLLTCHASPQKKSENKCNVSSDFFTVEVRVEVFPPSTTLLNCQLLVHTPTLDSQQSTWLYSLRLHLVRSHIFNRLIKKKGTFSNFCLKSTQSKAILIFYETFSSVLF